MYGRSYGCRRRRLFVESIGRRGEAASQPAGSGRFRGPRGRRRYGVVPASAIDQTPAPS